MTKAKKSKGLPRGTKEERIEYARSLIIANPAYGKKRINELIRKKYQTGLRSIDVARLKEVTLIGRPKARTGIVSVERLLRDLLLPEEVITKSEVVKSGFDETYMKLRSASFIGAEIRYIFTTANPLAVFNSKPFKQSLRERRKWYRNRRKAGLSKRQIIDEIKRYYIPGQKQNPFDFTKDAYNPPPEAKFNAGEERKRIEAERRISTLGGTYR